MITAPRGTLDIFGINALKMAEFENRAKAIFRKHNFQEIRTPTFEDLLLFTRSIGQETDIVSKEMYVFADRKGKNFALRPEGTAPFARAYIQHRLDLIDPIGKYFYSGQMFRYERPQAGRYREFAQMGAEYVGNGAPSADAQMIIMACDILSSIGLKNIKVHLNSLGCAACRAKFKEALIQYFLSIEDLCSNCKIRISKNPLRVLDCKIDADKFLNAPRITDFLCDDCAQNFSQVQDFLKSAGYDFIVDHKLVRGLDYYTRVVFELRSQDVGSQDALAAGGRYDNLIKELGGQNLPAVGFALGVSRVLLAAQNANVFNDIERPKNVYIGFADEALKTQAFSYAMKISKEGLKTIANFNVLMPLTDKSLTAQLKFANKAQADFAIIFAQTEYESGKLIFKDMAKKTQENRSIDEI
ncbi:MAG: histidine--tRNA ligase [Elusimicrobiota bacterium]|jgi:histidyl-tRNA synthetase|nr:histidine--tRNA ligase [Elusimicrobiota bacterium]